MPLESGSYLRDPATGELKRTEAPTRRLSIAERRERDAGAATAASLAGQGLAIVGEQPAVPVEIPGKAARPPRPPRSPDSPAERQAEKE